MNRISVFARRQRIKKLEEWATRAVLAAAFFLAIFPSVAAVAIIVATGAWFLRLHVDSKFTLRSLPFDVPVAIFVLLGAVSVYASPARDLELIYKYLSMVGIFALAYLMVGQNFRTAEQIKWFVKALALSTLVVVLGGFFQYVFGIDVAEMAWIDGEAFPEMRKRVFSTMASPSVLAGFLDAMICLALGLLARVSDGRVKFLAVVSIILAGACLVMTYSRGAFVALAVVFVVCGILQDLRILAAFALATGILIYTNEAFLERILSLFTGTPDAVETLRTGIWVSTIAMIADHPFAGIGWGAFEKIFPQYNHFLTAAPIPIVNAHNLYLNVAAEVGIAGALAYFWYFFGTMLTALAKTKTPTVNVDAAPGAFTEKLVEIFLTSSFLQSLTKTKSMLAIRLGDASNKILDKIFPAAEPDPPKAVRKNPELVHHEEMKWSAKKKAAKKKSDDDDTIDMQKFAAELEDEPEELDSRELKRARDSQIMAGVRLGTGLAFLSMAVNGMSDDLLGDVPSSILMWMLGALAAAINLLDEE